MTSKKPKPETFQNPEKITQLQCQECNAGLRQQFNFWLTQSFKYLPNFTNLFYLEIEAVISFIEYRLTISMGKPQPGDFLQNIQFRPITKSQQLMWLLLSVVLPYLKKKLVYFTSSSEMTFCKKLNQFLGIFDRIYTVLQYLNYAVFILKGQYRSLVQRILKIRMQFINQESKRVLNFALMNRMLIWQIYQMFLKTVLPSVFRFVGSSLKNIFYLSSYMQVDNNDSVSKCTFCGTLEIIMPMKSKTCSHLGCYYCTERSKTKEGDKCRLCGVQIDGWMPLRI